jgi:peptide chain release factor 1
MLEKLKLIDDKYTELENKMASPEYYNDPSAITKLAREQKELAPIVTVFGSI